MSDEEEDRAVYCKIHESEYGGSPLNFHVSKFDDTLSVELTYPPYTDAKNTNSQCRYIHVNQESVRASDGVRLHYDFDRDGFVVEQCRPRLIALGNRKYDEEYDWSEVGFFKSWQLNDRGGEPSKEEFEEADRKLLERKDTLP